MQTIVLFDAVGTIIETVPAVVEIYHRYGQAFGSRRSIGEIKSRFAALRKKLFAAELSADKECVNQLVSSDSIERELWRQFVAGVFDDVGDTSELFVELWDAFADPKTWRSYADAQACFDRLEAAGCIIGIASNFDRRLLSILPELISIRDNRFVFCSAEVGYRKPDLAFYQNVQSQILSAINLKPTQVRFVMTGDCRQNDCLAPKLFGWDAVWLNRRESDAGLSNHRQSVGNLSAFADVVLF